MSYTPDKIVDWKFHVEKLVSTQALSRWSPACTSLALRYVDCYGIYFSVMHKEILEDIRKELSIEFGSINGQSLLLETIWNRSDRGNALRALYRKEARTYLRCPFCGKAQKRSDVHPVHVVANRGLPLFCNDCAFSVRPLYPTWDNDLLGRAIDVAANFATNKNCKRCDRQFSLTRTFKDQNFVSPWEAKDWPGKWHDGGSSIEEVGLYPNLFFPLCARCTFEIYSDLETEDEDLLAQNLREVGELAATVPGPKLHHLLWTTRSSDDVWRMLQALDRCGSVLQYKRVFGSWNEALLRAGFFDNGLRRGVYGIVCKSRDGHLCLSRAEQEIDDILFQWGVEHWREPNYPDSCLRADWEVLGGSKRCLVEYFGLTGDLSYDEKSRTKQKLAQASGIHLICLHPGTSTRQILRRGLEEIGIRVDELRAEGPSSGL
jgi:hypothetical protein